MVDDDGFWQGFMVVFVVVNGSFGGGGGGAGFCGGSYVFFVGFLHWDCWSEGPIHKKSRRGCD